MTETIDVGTLDLLELEAGLDNQVACENEQCDRAATWVLNCPRCPLAVLVCQKHRDEYEALLREWLGRGGYARCLACGTTMASPEDAMSRWRVIS